MGRSRLRGHMDPAVSLKAGAMVRSLQVTIQLHQALLAPRVTPRTVTGSSHQVPINRDTTSHQAINQAPTRRVTANPQATGSRSQATVDPQCIRKPALTANEL
jgi:hypothetical protein